jgi:hypothetical protein
MSGRRLTAGAEAGLTRAAKASDCDRGAAIGGEAATGAGLTHRRGGENMDGNGHADAGCSERVRECGGPGAGEGGTRGLMVPRRQDLLAVVGGERRGGGVVEGGGLGPIVGLLIELAQVGRGVLSVGGWIEGLVEALERVRVVEQTDLHLVSTNIGPSLSAIALPSMPAIRRIFAMSR